MIYKVASLEHAHESFVFKRIRVRICIHSLVCISSCHMAKNVVNHSLLTARGLKLVIKRGLNFLSVQNTREWRRQKISYWCWQCLLTVVVYDLDVIGGSGSMRLEIWGSTMTRAWEKKGAWFIFPWNSTPFQDTPCLHVLYIYLYIWNAFLEDAWNVCR